VHLARFPEADDTLIDKELEARMELAQKISSMGLALRKKSNIIVKQPLQKLMIPVNAEMKARLEAVESLIKNELNVKEIVYVESSEDILVKKVKCNFKVLGKKFGPLMKQVAVAVASMSQQQIATLEEEGRLTFVLPDGHTAEIEVDEVEIFSEDIPGWVVANEGVLTVALDITVTDELRLEGMARELVSKIQNIRKSSGFEISDRIVVRLTSHPRLDAAIAAHNAYIAGQVLADSIVVTDSVAGDAQEVEFDGFTVKVEIKKDPISIF
jgi:isoleucyl-tRNA synthetase